MSRARSIYIAFEAFPRPKGSSAHISAMVSALANGFGPVWLICLGHGDMPLAQVEGEVTIFRHKLYHPNLLKRAESFFGFVREMIGRAGPDLKLCVFRDPFSGVPALLSLSPSTAVVFEVNALPSWELPYTYPAVAENFSLLAKLRDQERFCLLSSEVVLTVSAVTREALINLGVPADKIFVVPNSANEVFFQEPEEPPPIPELSEGEWFGYVGSLHPWQGLETALMAFSLVQEDLPQVRMLILTSARKSRLKEWQKRVRKLNLAERVLFAASLSPEQASAAMRRLCFTVAPLTETSRNTVQGCCPIKIIESLAAGVPVLASNLAVTRELLRPGQDSLLLPPGEPRAWALAIRRMFTEPGLAATLAQGGRESASARYTQQHACSLLNSIFYKAMDRRAENAGEGARR